jgi:hypothetical protein
LQMFPDIFSSLLTRIVPEGFLFSWIFSQFFWWIYSQTHATGFMVLHFQHVILPSLAPSCFRIYSKTACLLIVVVSARQLSSFD